MASLQHQRQGLMFHDLEKSAHLEPVSKQGRHKLFAFLVVECAISLAIYFEYTTIVTTAGPLIAPTLLGASTAALAQSMNQYFRKKFSFNRIVKFVAWGSINGLFTVLWIDTLVTKIDNIALRIITDQLVGAPCFQIVFNILNSLWDAGEISAATRLAFFKSLKYSYCYWPFFSVLSFVLIPQTMMFPANCLANLIWNLILSRIA